MLNKHTINKTSHRVIDSSDYYSTRSMLQHHNVEPASYTCNCKKMAISNKLHKEKKIQNWPS